MFGTIASTYDRVNHIISFNTDKRWRKKAAMVILEGYPSGILDVACGTADLTIEMHRQRPEAEITGIDISAEMLESGVRKIKTLFGPEILREVKSMSDSEDKTRTVNSGFSYNDGRLTAKIALKQGDAENMDFENDTFDAVTIAFGIRNIRERRKALRELRRVLKKEGKLMVLEFAIPQKGMFSILYKVYFNCMLPYIGGLVSGNIKAYRYFVQSVKEFPAPSEFVSLLTECGFRIEKTVPLTGGAAWIYLAAKDDK